MIVVWSPRGARVLVPISEVKGHADDEMVRHGRVRQVDKVGTELMKLLTSVGVGFLLMSLTAGGILRKLVSIGITLCVICTGSSLQWLGLRLMMMAWVAVLVTLWFGELAPCPIGVRLLRQLGSLPCGLDHKLFRLVAGRIGLSGPGADI